MQIKKENYNLIQKKALHYYINNGYSVIPCKPDKRPALPSWKQYQTVPATEDTILEWFAKPHTNIGIITGKVSGLTVIDIDAKDNQANADHLLTVFPETYTVKTPSGGYHLYYQYADGFTVSANAYPQYPNMDIRGEAGYVVAPPSKTTKGEYAIIKDIPITSFPTHLFPKQKPRKTLTEKLTAKNGNRNDNLTSFAGQLLQAEKDQDKWYTDVLPAVQRANKTYIPSLSDEEVLTVFNSIAKKEKKRRENLPAVMTTEEGEEVNISRSRSGLPFMNMSNVVAILEAHPDFRDKIRYNLFRQEIEIDGAPIEDNDILKIQYILQTKFGLHSINKEAVFSALVHCAYDNAYDEAKDWLTGLKWDGNPRLYTWLISATGVQDNEYNRGVGTQWFMQIIRRIMHPGCIADYMLVLVGGQGIGKTSLFRILGGKWYKSFTGSVENKDFYLALRGAIIIDLDEGATLYKAEAIKIKSIITETHDEFRAPYDRVPKKFPRRFVFSMSTNEIEPFRDATGNRRYWAVDIEQTVNFKWLEDNRDQLFAEALYRLQDEEQRHTVPEVPLEDAKRIQQEHLPDDSWADLIVDEVRKSAEYCEGSENYSTTVSEVFKSVFPEAGAIRLDRKHEIRIANIFKHQLGLTKIRKMIDGEQKNRWYISEEKKKQLQSKHAKQYKPAVDQLADELADDDDDVEIIKPTLKELGF